MEYTETDFTDALIEALCGETTEDAEQAAQINPNSKQSE